MHIALNIEEDTFLRLSSGGLRGENESEMIAAQDQALQTEFLQLKYYREKQVT